MKSVFVSSTFKDMQAERDMLQMRVFPKVRKELSRYGEDIAFLDLRWGVDTLDLSEDESGHLVLKVCIDAIDRCVPYVIVFLGERYGWIPDRHLIETVNDQRIEDLYEDEMSVTNLEIKYGAFQRSEHLDHVIFCLRDRSFLDEVEQDYLSVYQSESPFHQMKMNELKHRILTEFEANVILYNCHWDQKNHQICGLEELENQIVQKLLECMKETLDVSVNHHPMEDVKREMSSIQRQHLLHYVPRWYDEYKMLDLINTSLGMSRFKTHYHIQAGAGTGKTAFLSQVAKICAEENAHSILYYFKTGSGQNMKSLKQYLIYRLEEILKVSHLDSDDLDKRLQSLDIQIDEKTQVICFIDGLDQAFIDQNDMFFDLNEICPKVLFVVSSLKDFKIHCKKMKSIVIDELDEKQVHNIVFATAKNHGKKVDFKTAQTIDEKQSCRNPLYLSNLLQRLFMMSGKEFLEAQRMKDGIEGISMYMTKLIDELPENLEELVKTVIREAIEQFEHPQFKDIVCLIAASEKGLSENELREIFELDGQRFDLLRFSQLVTYLYDVFAQNDNGKWGFTHRLYHSAIIKMQMDPYLKMLSNYALKNREFLVREGYVYLLKTHHPDAYLCMDASIDRYQLIQILKETLQQNNGKDFISAVIKNADSDLCYEILNQLDGQDDLLNQLIESGKCSASTQMKHLIKQFHQHKNDIAQLELLLNQMRKLDDGKNEDFHLKVLVHEGRFHEYQKQNSEAKKWYMKAFDACLKMNLDHDKKLITLQRISEDMMYVDCADDYSMDPYLFIEEELQKSKFDLESDLTLVQIDNHKFLAKGYQVQKYYNPNKMVNHMQKAVTMAKNRVNKTHKAKDYRQVISLSKDFARILRPELQYWAINLGYDEAKELFQLTQEVDDQWLLADMAHLTANSYDVSYRMTIFDHSVANKKDQFGNLMKNHLAMATKHYEIAYEHMSQCSKADTEYKNWYKMKAMTIQVNWRALQIESGQYLKPKNALMEMMNHPDFNELNQHLQCKVMFALLKALLINRAYQYEETYNEKKTDETIWKEALDISDRFMQLVKENPVKYRQWMAWSCYYRSLLMFELNQDDEASFWAKEALKLSDALSHVHERNCFEAMMNTVQILISLAQGTVEKELIEKISTHNQTYSFRNRNSLHDVHTMLYEELPVLIQLNQYEFVENAGEKLRNTHQYFSLRLKKWVERLVLAQSIKTRQLDNYLWSKHRNRFNQYPDYGDEYIQLLNQVVSSIEINNEDKGLSLYAHTALIHPDVHCDSHACLLARTMWKESNFEHAVSFYQSAMQKHPLSPLDQFAYDSSICLMQWLENKEITHSINQTEYTGTTQEKLMAEALYEFLHLPVSQDKVASLMTLNKVLPEIYGFEINLITLGLMDCIHRYKLFEQCTGTQLLMLKKGLIHHMNSRREWAELSMDYTWYEYEQRKIDKMKQLDYRKSLMKVNLQFAQCLKSCGEAHEAVIYYDKAYSNFTRYEAEIKNVNDYTLDTMLEGLHYNEEDVEDLKTILSGFISTLPSKDPKQLFHFSTLPAVAVKLAQKENQMHFIETAASILRYAKIGTLEEHDAIVNLCVFALKHGFDTKELLLDELAQTKVPLTRTESIVKQIKFTDTQKKRLHEIYENCAKRLFNGKRDWIYYRTEKTFRYHHE